MGASSISTRLSQWALSAAGAPLTREKNMHTYTTRYILHTCRLEIVKKEKGPIRNFTNPVLPGTIRSARPFLAERNLVLVLLLLLCCCNFNYYCCCTGMHDTIYCCSPYMCTMYSTLRYRQQVTSSSVVNTFVQPKALFSIHSRPSSTTGGMMVPACATAIRGRIWAFCQRG